MAPNGRKAPSIYRNKVVLARRRTASKGRPYGDFASRVVYSEAPAGVYWIESGRITGVGGQYRLLSSLSPLLLTRATASELDEAPLFAPRKPRHLSGRAVGFDDESIGKVRANPELRIVQSRLDRKNHPRLEHRGIAQRQIGRLMPLPALPVSRPMIDVGCYAALHRSEEHTSELQSRLHLVCRLLLEKK